MKPVPWRYVGSWNCIACGACCRGFDVVLALPEWVNIIRSYGVEFTKPSISKFHLRRRSDGSCVFLYKFFDRWLCGLQHMKPAACKLWPFKILSGPKFGGPNEASYNYKGQRLYVYVDPSCIGVQWGNPTREFIHNTLTEIVEIALGLRQQQHFSTSRIPYRPVYFRARGRKIV